MTAGKEDESEFYAVHAGSANTLSKYQKRLLCVDQTELELAGDLNSERGRSVRFAFETCDQSKLSEGLECKAENDIKNWLKQKYIIIYAN